MKKSDSEKVVGSHDHPYLIRTTSSSLLTRSNSIGAVHKPAIVHTAIGPSSPALGRSQGRGHKKTKSQSAVPPSLPLPPSTPTSPAVQDLPPLSPSPSRSPNPGNLRLRLRRSDTLPSMPARTPESPSKFKPEDLPENPKAWTSIHLASYLSSALRIRGGGALPLPVIRDVATFVVNQKLSGRVFLRLTEGDLEEMGMNQLWRPSFLSASRALRQNVVQGRIWGFGSAVPEEEEEEVDGEPRYVNSNSNTRSKHMSLPGPGTETFKLVLDTISEPDSAHSEGEAETWIKGGTKLSFGRKRAGKVKGLVANFERSASSSSSLADDEDYGTGFALLRSPSDGSEASPGVSSDGPIEFDLRSPHEGDVLYVDGGATLSAPHDLDAEYEGRERDIDAVENDEPSLEKLRSQPTPWPPMQTILVPTEDQDQPSPVPPCSAAPPQTPPPSYSVTGEETTPPCVLGAQSQNQTPTRHGHGSPSQTIILSATNSARRKNNLSYVAEVTFENATEDGAGVEEEQTISELLANIDASGANAWLNQDENGVETTNARKSTAKKVFESVRSISRKANRPPSFSAGTSPARSKGSVAAANAGGRPGLIGLFDPILPAPPVRTMADIGISTDDELELEAPAVSVPATEAMIEGRQALLLEDFRARLEEVERRLEEMEMRDAEKEREREDAEIQRRLLKSKNTSANSSPQLGDVDDSAFSSFGSLSMFSLEPSQNRAAAIRDKDTAVAVATEDVNQDEWEDPSLSGLPSYVLLVGLGVCSIVMRVVIKRIVGSTAL
ncbi:hypothetical protein FRB96_005622 [Tulasnella sp. 330]|nr:hypothetical protein FRB96_005622 [Tulasnella sp. 330]KAG8886380.1 hypothetical protein FRB97_004915 [Tulasnella sp. 331]KAG8890750.1 hypothetical protein FRB98_004795 [Tulasnella sp. 332]